MLVNHLFRSTDSGSFCHFVQVSLINMCTASIAQDHMQVEEHAGDI